MYGDWTKACFADFPDKSYSKGTQNSLLALDHAHQAVVQAMILHEGLFSTPTTVGRSAARRTIWTSKRTAR